MDKYDKAIQQLMNTSNFREAVNTTWLMPFDSKPGCLFTFVSPSGDTPYKGQECGCLTSVKAGLFDAYTPELTEMIRTDDRIPKDPNDIKNEQDLQVFAELQRKIDAMIRVPAGAVAE